ncbi:NAD-dependent epimerase/dehydratase family protein [Candidatus Bipolaricaulota bacterium]|nr:NAD-dependent epimerase/dehydratase family protein [Candidatus Bipolaricaulota bacterium]
MGNTKRILVTGAVGQIGSELTLALRDRYGSENVVAAGHRSQPSPVLRDSGPFTWIDVTDRSQLKAAVVDYKINTIYHMSAILSAVGEKKPQLAWEVNIDGLTNVLEVARELNTDQVFLPSSIAVFGPETPRDCAPQNTVLRPTTMYGVTKVAGELLCKYYVERFGMDIRGLRYPGIISSETLPGGGTTDYAVAIFYAAVAGKPYVCFVREDTVLPMMYMPDCIKATIDLMEADRSRLSRHADFNIAALSFSASALAAEIGKLVPGFTCTYEPDFRQRIADSWPKAVDDSAARKQWDWQPDYDLPSMTRDMIDRLSERARRGDLPDAT